MRALQDNTAFHHWQRISWKPCRPGVKRGNAIVYDVFIMPAWFSSTLWIVEGNFNQSLFVRAFLNAHQK